jgi:GNAT superfamily N-acetyltransferase
MADESVVVEPADVRSAEATLLLARLTAELAHLYGDDGGIKAFSAADLDVPRSGFVVARVGGIAAGCGAFRPYSSDSAEIKRMYVEPAYRGRGLGRRVLEALEDGARRAGYAKVRLETGTAQPEALGLYRAAGYYQIECYGHYRDDPRSVCFEKVL